MVTKPVCRVNSVASFHTAHIGCHFQLLPNHPKSLFCGAPLESLKKEKKRSSIKLHTITNTTPQITHKVLAGRVRWAFDVWHAVQAIRCQPTRDLFCCSCLLSVGRCDTKCAYSAHQLPTDGQPDRTTARFTASRAVSMPHFGRRVHMR